MKANEIRDAFLKFFENAGHERVQSSPVIPAADPTLLFTNAGMVQFKDLFLGVEQRSYTRATSSQTCIRAGGKHNDLDNVGYTQRHHTFFEMLGNFSFGDYFKSEAIHYAWEFLTEVLKLPEERLWITVYKDDSEAEKIWLEDIGVDPTRFSRCGEKDNFWAMGDTGPCGPCTEIFYDHGPEIAGGPPGSPTEDGDRYVEIWNLVFMQYDRDHEGNLNPLPKPSVDTGMGLERIAAVMQGVHSNYDIDMFQALIREAMTITGATDPDAPSLKVLADHIRAAVFVMSEGVYPSNEGRGYVLRRIIRRAVRHGYKLGADKTFFYHMVDPLIREMGVAYPKIVKQRNNIVEALMHEEQQFERTLAQGLQVFENAVRDTDGTVIPGDVIFKLYDTFGFPVDMTADMARERSLDLDMPGFEDCMEKQRTRARGQSGFKQKNALPIAPSQITEFTGYDTLEHPAKVVAIFRNDQAVETLSGHETGVVVLDRSPFYAESGGQVGDRGKLHIDDAWFEVNDTQKQNQTILHFGVVSQGELRVGDEVLAEVDREKREETMRHHSSAHLFHAAIRNILGEHVIQKGSLVSEDVMRFDFAYPKAVSPNQIRAIEDLVNEKILDNAPIQKETMSINEAKQAGAIALFGEKYGETVRVLNMANGFSVELCGGTHCNRTGDIGCFKITSESGVAAGIRRVTAVVGKNALEHMRKQDDVLRLGAEELKADINQIPEKIAAIQAKLKAKEKEVADLRHKLLTDGGSNVADKAKMVGDVSVIAERFDGDPKGLRTAMDQLKKNLGSGVIVLGAARANKVSLIAGVTDDLTDRFRAGDLIKALAGIVGGSGGGRPDMAQAGGTEVQNLDKALAAVIPWIAERVES